MLYRYLLLKHVLRDTCGQGTAEYALILSLIAVAGIASYSMFSSGVFDIYGGVTDGLNNTLNAGNWFTG